MAEATFLTVDTTQLLFAVVNALKEINDRLVALEGP